MTEGHNVSVEIEVADGLAGIGRFFGFLDRFLKLLIQQFGSVFLVFYRLAKDGVATAILLSHGVGGRFHIIEHLGFDGGGMGNDGLAFRIHLEHRAAARAGHLEKYVLGHLKKSYRITPG